MMPYGCPDFYKLAGNVCAPLTSTTLWIAGVRYVQLKEILADTLDRNTSANLKDSFNINVHTYKLKSLIKSSLKVYK